MEKPKLLLHICCAPDSTVPWPKLIDEGYETVGFFYGGNIQPQEEYEKRKNALLKFANIISEKAILLEYDTKEWFAKTELYKNEPERGKRCVICFSVQLEACAKYASENGYTHISTTLTISPHKDPNLINEIGFKLAEKYGLTWIEKVWRKNNGFKQSVEECKKYDIYRQNYCGCAYSIRTTEIGEADGK